MSLRHVRIETSGKGYEVLTQLGMPLGPRLDHGQGLMPEIPEWPIPLEAAQELASKWETFIELQRMHRRKSSQK